MNILSFFLRFGWSLLILGNLIVWVIFQRSWPTPNRRWALLAGMLYIGLLMTGLVYVRFFYRPSSLKWGTTAYKHEKRLEK